jgi:hypothetical protein
VIVSDQHPSAKRQRAVGGRKSVWSGDLAACSLYSGWLFVSLVH